MPVRVLIVEDSPTEALRARLILEREGYQVSLAADGHEGLFKAALEQPNLILLDTVLPRMSGFEVCGRLRLDPLTRALAVVMLAGADELADMPSGAEAVRFVAKPYDPQRLVATVKELTSGNGHCPSEADLTGRLHSCQAELEQARREVAAANQARSDFLANMSHELRTPLHEIIGMIALALGTELTAEQQTYLNTARASSESLATLVGDILEFSEVEAGQLTLEEHALDVRNLIEKIVEVMTPRAREQSLKFSAVVSPRVPRLLRGDCNRLRQVLAHLVGNAIKFTAQGEVAVSVDISRPQASAQIRPASAGTCELHFVVRDTGDGIPKGKQGIVFEPFRQADTSAMRRYGGLGLGLAVAHHLVTLMGGRLWVESDGVPGLGSAFHFALPLKLSDEAPASASVEQPLRALNVLLAEDSLTNQFIAVTNLEKAGHTFTVVDTGRKAVEAFETAGQAFDVVLMDLAMPEMDGLAATQAIREKERLSGGHVPIIAMTAFTTREYRDKCVAAGMDGYVSKPVRMADLGKVIGPLLAKRDAPIAPPVDLKEALEVVGDDLDTLRQAVAMALDEIPAHLAKLRDAIAQQDASAVEASAHRLKGVMSNFGGRVARDLAQRLEEMAEQRRLDGGSEVVHALEVEIGRVLAFYSDPAWEERAECEAGKHG